MPVALHPITRSNLSVKSNRACCTDGPAARLGSRRSVLKSVRWTDLTGYAGRTSPHHPLQSDVEFPSVKSALVLFCASGSAGGARVLGMGDGSDHYLCHRHDFLCR